MLSVTRSQGETQKRKGRGLPKISIGYLLSPGFVNLSRNTPNPSSCRGVRYHWNLYDLLQTEAFNATLCLLSLQFFHFSGEKRGQFFSGAWRLREVVQRPIQHFNRHGLVHIQTLPRWTWQGNGVLETMAWQFSKVRVKGRQPQLPSLKSMCVWHWKQPLERPEGHPSCLLPKGPLTNVVHRAWGLLVSLPGP